MTMTSSLHRVSKVTAFKSGKTEWLEIEAETGSCVSIFMPYETALAMSSAFAANHKPLPVSDGVVW